MIARDPVFSVRLISVYFKSENVEKEYCYSQFVLTVCDKLLLIYAM